MEQIEFECPYCERVSKVPFSFAGRQGKCPGCQKVIQVPDPGDVAAAVAESAALAAPPPLPLEEPDTSNDPAAGEVIGGPATGEVIGAPIRVDVPASEEQPCPYCGERIKRQAKKCRFCGEFLDRNLRGNRRRMPGLGNHTLASPGLRLAGFMIDEILLRYLPITGLLIGGGIAMDNRAQEIGIVLLSLAGIWYFALLIYQWYLTATRGQTIAKRWLGMKIVRLTGAPVDFVSGVILRTWITGFLEKLSWLGCLFFIVDACLIFGQDRRCMHDHIASTRVVLVPDRPSSGASA